MAKTEWQTSAPKHSQTQLSFLLEVCTCQVFEEELHNSFRILNVWMQIANAIGVWKKSALTGLRHSLIIACRKTKRGNKNCPGMLIPSEFLKLFSRHKLKDTHYIL